MLSSGTKKTVTGKCDSDVLLSVGILNDECHNQFSNGEKFGEKTLDNRLMVMAYYPSCRKHDKP